MGETTQDGHEEFRDSLGPGAFQDSQEAGDEGPRPLNVEGLVDELETPRRSRGSVGLAFFFLKQRRVFLGTTALQIVISESMDRKRGTWFSTQLDLSNDHFHEDSSDVQPSNIDSSKPRQGLSWNEDCSVAALSRQNSKGKVPCIEMGGSVWSRLQDHLPPSSFWFL